MPNDEVETDPAYAARRVQAAGLWLRYLVLGIGGIIALLPFLYMIADSLKSYAETVTRVNPNPLSPEFWPIKPLWTNYAKVWLGDSFGRYFLNSVLISAVILAVTLVPNFLVIASLGWVNRLAGLTVPFTASAFYIFLLRQFFKQVPTPLLESARIEGASEARILASIVLPLCRAPVFTVMFLSLVSSWNALEWPLVVVQTPT